MENDSGAPVDTAAGGAASASHKVSLPEGAFAGRGEFQQLIRNAIQSAADEGWREMIWFDLNYADWPLAERSVIESLQAWSQSGRKLTMVAKRFDVVLEKQHRFVAWRKQWSHIVEARGVSAASEEEFPSLLVAPTWILHRVNPAWSKGITSCEPARRLAAKELMAEWLSQSAPAFPATTLGL